MSDIFLSYARKDRQRAAAIAKALETQGWSVWWDWNIPAGKKFREVIDQEIRKALCMVVLWSEASVKRDWVVEEAEDGQKRRILVPVLIEPVQPPRGFRLIAAADLSEWRGNTTDAAFRKLCQNITDAAFRKLCQNITLMIGPSAVAAEVGPAPNAQLTVPVEEVRYVDTPARSQPKLDVEGESKRWWSLALEHLLEGLYSPLAFLAVCVFAVVAVFIYTSFRNAVEEEFGLKTRDNSKDGVTYVWIPPGEFRMGCSQDDQECYPDEKPAHEVTITKGFWMGQTEVRQEAYELVTGNNPSQFKGPRLPVEGVTWDEAQAYCKATGMRLPTEAEWEYAARGRDATARYGRLDPVAWYGGNSGSKTHEVGQKQQNLFSLYDVLGNVWEWVADWYEQYEQKASMDPTGPLSGRQRVLRGGSWYDPPTAVRASIRYRTVPELRDSDTGFRCAGELP